MNENKQIGSSVVWNTVGTMYYYACQWIITILVVKISGYTLAGYLSLAMTITNTFYAIAQFGMRQFQVSDLQEKYTVSTYIGSRYVSVVIAITLCVIYMLIGDYDQQQLLCTIAYMLLKAVEAYVDVYQGIQQKHWRFDIIGISYLIRGTILVCAFCVCLKLTQDLMITLLIIAVLSFVVVVSYDIRLTGKFSCVTGKIKDKKIYQLFGECVPIVLFNFLLSLVTLISRNTLQDLNGVEQLGIYASIASPTVVIQLLASVIFNPFVPLFAQYYIEKNNKAFYKLLLKFFVALVVLAGGSVFLAKMLGRWALVLLLGESIEPYVYLLIPVIGCTIITAVIWLLSAIMIAMRKLVSLLISTIISCVLAYMIAIPMIQVFGMNGASYIVICSGVSQIVIMLFVCLYSLWKNTKEK